MTEEYPEPRQERREKRHASRKTRMDKHGKELAQLYRHTVLKRLRLDKDRRKY